MAHMYTFDRHLQAMSHDPVREVSRRVEQLAIDKVKEDILKLTGVVVVVVAILAPVCLQIFPDVSFTDILQTAQVLHMAVAAVILQIMACKMVSHTALVAWQMSDPEQRAGLDLEAVKQAGLDRVSSAADREDCPSRSCGSFSCARCFGCR